MKTWTLQDLWNTLEDIPINDNEEIEQAFLHFKPGTPKERIWHWFEEAYGISVAEYLMFNSSRN